MFVFLEFGLAFFFAGYFGKIVAFFFSRERFVNGVDMANRGHR